MSAEQLQQVQDIVAPIIKGANLELFDLVIKIYRGTANIELFIDRPNGGIVINECADVNRKIALAVEENGLFGDDYTVSVSSPGLDWPLKTAKDFRRSIGREIEVQHIDDGVTTKKIGALEIVSDEKIVMKTLEGEVEMLLENIDKAFLMI